jgi:hypothetical protein
LARLEGRNTSENKQFSMACFRRAWHRQLCLGDQNWTSVKSWAAEDKTISTHLYHIAQTFGRAREADSA